MVKSDRLSNKAPQRGSMKRMLRDHFLRHWRWFAAGTLFAALTSVAAASYGLLLKYVVEAMEQMTAAQAGVIGRQTWLLIALIGAAAILRSVSLYLMTIFNNTGVQQAIVDVQKDQYAALIRGDFSRVSGDASGGFVSRFINDVNSLRDAGLRLANNLTKGVLTLIAVFITMLIMDWKLSLILLITYPIALGPVIALGNRVRTRARHAQKQVGEVTSLLSEGFQSARIVKAYGLEDYQTDRANAGFADRARLYLKVLRDKAAVDPILEITGGMALVGILALTAWRISTGDTTLGNFVGIIGAVAVAAPEVRALGTLNAVVQEGGAAADRVYEVLDAVPELDDAPDAQMLQAIRGAIQFEDAQFEYPDGTQALDGLSFTVQPGETVALVGPSGAGKSTVFNMLLRLYDPLSGRVKVDDKDIRSVTAVSLRSGIALVAQDAALFDDTIRANIVLGRLGASEAEIEAAARAANAHDFIEAMPGGYSAPAGEMGRNLSGGQRQRIALARAILRDAPILLLDEATSALDAASEAKVQAALAAFSQGRTTLIIAHRLSTVRAADRIIVMEDGRAIEEGSHDALMAAGGAYARLARLQLG